jgi:hypothetical protein
MKRMEVLGQIGKNKISETSSQPTNQAWWYTFKSHTCNKISYTGGLGRMAV